MLSVTSSNYPQPTTVGLFSTKIWGTIQSIAPYKNLSEINKGIVSNIQYSSMSCEVGIDYSSLLGRYNFKNIDKILRTTFNKAKEEPYVLRAADIQDTISNLLSDENPNKVITQPALKQRLNSLSEQAKKGIIENPQTIEIYDAYLQELDILHGQETDIDKKNEILNTILITLINLGARIDGSNKKTLLDDKYQLKLNTTIFLMPSEEKNTYANDTKLTGMLNMQNTASRVAKINNLLLIILNSSLLEQQPNQHRTITNLSMQMCNNILAHRFLNSSEITSDESIKIDSLARDFLALNSKILEKLFSFNPIKYAIDLGYYQQFVLCQPESAIETYKTALNYTSNPQLDSAFSIEEFNFNIKLIKNNLAYLYLLSNDPTKQERAVELYQEITGENDVISPAFYHLGTMYEKGLGRLIVNQELANTCYEKAANLFGGDNKSLIQGYEKTLVNGNTLASIKLNLIQDDDYVAINGLIDKNLLSKPEALANAIEEQKQDITKTFEALYSSAIMST